MPKAENDVQDMSINDPLQKISVKMSFYFSIFKQSVLNFFENNTLVLLIELRNCKRKYGKGVTEVNTIWEL